MCSTGCNLKVGGGFPLRPLTHCLLQYCSLGTWRRRSLCQPSISYQVVGTISKTTQWAAWWIIRHQLQSIAFRCLRKFDTYRQGAWQSAARRRRREEANKIYFFQKRVWITVRFVRKKKKTYVEPWQCWEHIADLGPQRAITRTSTCARKRFSPQPPRRQLPIFHFSNLRTLPHRQDSPLQKQPTTHTTRARLDYNLSLMMR